MKRRTSLVSNSSSTSYVVLVKNGGKTTKCEHCGRGGDYSLIESIEDSRDPETEVEYVPLTLSVRLQDLIDKLSKSVQTRQARLYEADQLEDLKEAQKEIREAKAEGWEAYAIRISYHDHYVSDTFQAMKKSDEIKVVMEDFCL